MSRVSRKQGTGASGKAGHTSHAADWAGRPQSRPQQQEEQGGTEQQSDAKAWTPQRTLLSLAIQGFVFLTPAEATQP